jgi:hypothetical protein
MRLPRRGLFASAAAVFATPASAQSAPDCSCQPPSVERVRRPLERAQSAIRRGTRYKLDTIPPHPDLQVWPGAWTCDCSGFIAWCFRIGRYPPELDDLQFTTDRVFRDAKRATDNVFFKETDRPRAGDVVVFRSYRLTPEEGSGDVGHIAILSAYTSATDFRMIDCASSSYKGPERDAIIPGDQTKFVNHRAQLAEVRERFPDIDPQYVQDPIFARFILPRRP